MLLYLVTVLFLALTSFLEILQAYLQKNCYNIAVMNMKIEKIVVGELKENCYVVINNKNEALVIDPGDEAKRILEFLKPYHVVGILVTHHHFDHIGALEELNSVYSLIENQVSSTDFLFDTIATPGHTDNSVSFAFSELGCVFVGDFIFKDGIGRTDLGGDEMRMKLSLKHFLEQFSDDTVLYPGHGEATTLGRERKFLENWIKM